jgi:hypothetical protein
LVVRVDADPAIVGRLGRPTLELVGASPRPFEPGDTIQIEGMQPGENRWVGLSFAVSQASERDVLPLNFTEVVDGTVVNGFALAARIAPLETVVLDRLAQHRSVFTRLAAGFSVGPAEEQARRADELLKRRPTPEDYREFLSKGLPEVVESLARFIKDQGGQDPFGIAAAVSGLRTPVESGGAIETVAAAHGVLLSKLDSDLTMRTLALGDPADILQNVRWQLDLYASPGLRDLACSAEVTRASREFAEAYSVRKRRDKDYPALVRTLLPCYKATAEALAPKGVDLTAELAAMTKQIGSPVALQKAHRDFLLKLPDPRR